MHGSPLSPHDNRRIFDELELEAEGLLGEPYLHLPKEGFLYLSDTGGRWDGGASSVRDESEGASLGVRSSFGLMEAIRHDGLPPKVHQTVHPQRWIEEKLPWLWEHGSQRVKNLLKRIMKRFR